MKPEDDSEAGAVKSCETPGCDKEAKLQCPTCIKLQIKVSIRSTSDLGGKQLGLSIRPAKYNNWSLRLIPIFK